MSRLRTQAIRLGALAAGLALLVTAPGCGDEEPSATTQAEGPATTRASDQAPPKPPAARGEDEVDREERDDGEDPPPEGKPSGPAETPDSDPRAGAAERAASRTVRSFVSALDRRDGSAACALLAPGVIDEVEMPRERGGCAASLEASIGYRDPRGLPVWKGAEVTQVAVTELDADSAKVIATVVTRFADREEFSVEDDVVYLARAGGDWAIAKASSTLYRAVGVADVPPTVLSPPAG